MKPVYLECQQCGDQLKELSMAEQQIVAKNPYKYVVYCSLCKKDLEDSIYV